MAIQYNYDIDSFKSIYTNSCYLIIDSYIHAFCCSVMRKCECAKYVLRKLLHVSTSNVDVSNADVYIIS